ncbi:FAD-binding oxidoreductase [Nocardioides sp. CFH 31398]|uniref:FAD-binding oxidoreductase n=1 Tax=Nocardioides sp. CFH 31398 TaxID=2919579 RepID=UPI001F056945|nr:FAD-binding oxidoreductase [Nocardioides sp. CFH 31398]MCH1868446.1 FAD-binding oxidoreductase [Nocardioides sp. CFH 31398]
MTGNVVGATEHLEAVERLRRSYDALPVDAPVRLAKSTTNLFRPREATGRGLDVSGLAGVVSIDPVARTAEVQGMCTYADLVDVTLAHGLVPLVVPQLRSITLGGAVAGLGIESTSFRHGLPHESVLEMDVFTGAGEVVTTRPGDELFDAFPNSYGSLGYATRLRIELAAVPPYVALRHQRFSSAGLLAAAVARIAEKGTWKGERVDALDGVAFAPGELYLTLARWTDEPGPTSDYTGERIYYRSLQQRAADRLTTHDYLWRWDTDWFWCSGAFGLEDPLVRRLWPRRLRRSDVYSRLVGLDRRYGVVDRLDARAGRPRRERVIQDVEVPVGRLAEFLGWFDAEVGMRPVWLCPLRLRGEAAGGGPGRTWPAYPLEPGTTYVNVGFWGTVRVGDGAEDGPLNRAIETRVHELGGHKSLYSEAFYDRATFDALYAGDHLAAVKRRHDPQDRLTSLYDKAVKRR